MHGIRLLNVGRGTILLSSGGAHVVCSLSPRCEATYQTLASAKWRPRQILKRVQSLLLTLRCTRQTAYRLPKPSTYLHRSRSLRPCPLLPSVPGEMHPDQGRVLEHVVPARFAVREWSSDIDEDSPRITATSATATLPGLPPVFNLSDYALHTRSA